MKQLGFFIALSILLHFLTTTSALYFSETFRSNQEKQEATQIEIITEDKSPLKERINETKQLIKQLKANLEKVKIKNQLTRFESETTQRVEKETGASTLGKTQNNTQQKENENLKNTSEKSKDIGDEPNLQPEFTRSKSVFTQSTISVELPSDIARSNATNLNTDANIHYSFYNRVEDLFYVRWVETVNSLWSRLDPNFKQSTLAGKTWSTRVEIWLKSTGEYHAGYITGSSGYAPFDQAALTAFKLAKFFPNPPKSKVEPDGFIRLRYRFNVHVSNR